VHRCQWSDNRPLCAGLQGRDFVKQIVKRWVGDNLCDPPCPCSFLHGVFVRMGWYHHLDFLISRRTWILGSPIAPLLSIAILFVHCGANAFLASKATLLSLHHAEVTQFFVNSAMSVDQHWGTLVPHASGASFLADMAPTNMILSNQGLCSLICIPTRVP